MAVQWRFRKLFIVATDGDHMQLTDEQYDARGLLAQQEVEAALAAARAANKPLKDGSIVYSAACRGARGVCVVTQHLSDYASSLDAFVMPTYHTFCLGVLRDFIEYLLSTASSLSASSKTTIRERQAALHIPTDYGRRPTCCIDDRGHWIIEDYLHFIFTTCTMLFAGLLDTKQSRLLGSGRQEKRRGLMHLDLEMWVERLMQYFKSWVGSHAVPMNLELSVAMKEELVRKGRAEHAKGDNVDGCSVMGQNWVEPVVVTIGGDFIRPGQGSESSPITDESRETCLATCDFLALNIDSETIYTHLSPRHLAALRGRRQRLSLMLTLEQRLGPYMTRARVEGVLGFLGYCEAVQSVEIRLIKDEATEEEPTYEQLPVGAWLAERLMTNFTNCHVLGIKPFLMLDSELQELISHQLLSVTEMYLTDVGNLPRSVTTLLISDLSVVLPEPNMAALKRGVADLSSGRFQRQHIGLLGMALTRNEGCAQVAALKPLVGRFREALVEVGEPGQVIQPHVVDAVIPMLKGCAGVQFRNAMCTLYSWHEWVVKNAMAPDWVTIESDGDFYWFHDDGGSTLIRKECRESCLATCECLVTNIDSEAITSHLSPRILAALRDRRHPLALQLIVTTLLGPHTMRYRVEGITGLLGRCEAVHSVEIRFIDVKPTMEEDPTYEQLPVGAWLAERLMANFPKCLSLRLQDFQCQYAQLAELLSHSHFLGSLQNLDIQELHIQDGSMEDGHYEWVEGYLGLTVLSTVYLGPVPTPLQPLLPHSKLMKLSLTETDLTAISLLPKTIQILNITYLHVNLPEPDQQAVTSGVAALSSGRFKTLDIGFVGLTITSLEGGGHASLAALKPLPPPPSPPPPPLPPIAGALLLGVLGQGATLHTSTCSKPSLVLLLVFEQTSKGLDLPRLHHAGIGNLFIAGDFHFVEVEKHQRVEAHRGHSEAINNETSGLPGPSTPKQLPPAQGSKDKDALLTNELVYPDRPDVRMQDLTRHLCEFYIKAKPSDQQMKDVLELLDNCMGKGKTLLPSTTHRFYALIDALGRDEDRVHVCNGKTCPGHVYPHLPP
ncbi:hypothetical protein V8C86DRAFT_3035500 [Haematococcus lacustris]